MNPCPPMTQGWVVGVTFGAEIDRSHDEQAIDHQGAHLKMGDMIGNRPSIGDVHLSVIPSRSESFCSRLTSIYRNNWSTACLRLKAWQLNLPSRPLIL